MTLRSSKTQLVKVSRNFGNDDIVLVCNDIVSDGIPETFRTGGEIRVEADDIQAVSIEIGGKKFLPAPNDEGSFVFTPALTE